MHSRLLFAAAAALGLVSTSDLHSDTPAPTLPAPAAPSAVPARELAITIASKTTDLGEGENLVISAYANWPDAGPAGNVMLHAQIDGKDWGAEFATIPSGVAHLVIPLPDRGTNSVTVTDGKAVSNPLVIQVHPRHFDIIDDPAHQMVIEYETWWGAGYAAWGKEEAVPFLGHYSSFDPRVVRQHALWFNDIGFNTVELDWTNNLTEAFPSPAAKECIAATDLLCQVYATMPQHPKILFLLGPEHNLWDSRKDVFDGPWFHQQLEFLWQHYINHPKYRDMYVKYEGKPLILMYVNGPHETQPPEFNDPRFTVRWVGAWQQAMHQDKWGVWSWYDQVATPVFKDGKCESVTVAAGFPAAHLLRRLEVNWADYEGVGRDYGETLKTQWKVAFQNRPQFTFVCQWNEFTPPDEYNANLSNDLEPTLLTEKGDPRPSGWGFEYYYLCKDLIAAFHQANPPATAAAAR